MNCKACAFNNNNSKECDIMSKRPTNCWAGCYTILELNKRYNDIRNYCGNTTRVTEVNKEYNKFLARLVNTETKAG